MLADDDALDCRFSPILFDMCLLEIDEPLCESIFEQTKHQIVIVLASELILLIKFLAWSSRQTQQIEFGKTANLYVRQSLVLTSIVVMNNGSRKTTTEYYL